MTSIDIPSAKDTRSLTVYINVQLTVQFSHGNIRATLVTGCLSFYVDEGGFLLRKWSCSDPSVLESIPNDLRDPQATIILSDSDQYTKTWVWSGMRQVITFV